jgi:hypothetical protein
MRTVENIFTTEFSSGLLSELDGGLAAVLAVAAAWETEARMGRSRIEAKRRVMVGRDGMDG